MVHVMSSVKSDRNDGGYSVLGIYTFANTVKKCTVTMGFPKYKVLSAAGKFITYCIENFKAFDKGKTMKNL